MLKKTRLLVLSLALGLAALPALAATHSGPAEDLARIAEQVRKRILTLPFYSLFDNVSFTLQGDKVTLNGEVYRPSMRKSVERAAFSVEGVNKVVNNVEILPTSTHDDRIRILTLRALYGHPLFDRYGIQAVPPIHIIVKNGDITLEGAVNREMEKNLAGILANGVSGAFSVTNNLRVEKI